MREPLESAYFNWLCAKVLDRNSRMYHDLLAFLHRTEFVWMEEVPADQHRAADGIQLRADFCRETHTPKDPIWFQQPCSVFEAFYAFAKRASFQTDIPIRNWFWEFIENLQLDQFRQVSNGDYRIIQNVVDNFMWRRYDQRGNGGLFPMRIAKQDQREVEIWYQFCDYVEDRGLI
jgi:hypothetical protein